MFLQKCNTDEIDDEMHVLLLCIHFETDRKTILVLVAGVGETSHTNY
jgi:hypothetical protein